MTMSSGQSARVVLLTVVMISGGVSSSTAQAPPTTVVTHGYQFTGLMPDWPFALADAIARRAAEQGGVEGQVLVYEGTSGALLPCQESWCTASGDAHSVIVFDWAADSNESGAGFSEAAAEALFAGLVSWSQGDDPLVDLTRLHLIGHSRGTVVNSEVAERLVAAGFPAPDQVTSLDPHDSGGAFVAAGQLPEGGLDDYDVNREHPEYDCHAQSSTPGVCSWVGVGYNDNYWQNDQGCTFFDPEGRELFGASNFNQDQLDDPFCHSDTHRWYLMTADTVTPTHPVTGEAPGPDWYSSQTVCMASPRTTPLSRTADGYNLSTAAGGTANRCPIGPNQQQAVLFDFALAEGVVNGDFERIRASGPQSGWSFHGGELQGTLGFDTDNYLILVAGQSALHNRFYLPPHTRAVQLCRKVETASATDSLSMLITSPGFPDRELLDFEQQDLSSTADWECLEAPVFETETGNAVQIDLSVTNQGSPVVLLDDIRLVFDIFSDGFESGDTTAWSATVE